VGNIAGDSWKWAPEPENTHQAVDEQKHDHRSAYLTNFERYWDGEIYKEDLPATLSEYGNNLPRRAILLVLILQFILRYSSVFTDYPSLVLQPVTYNFAEISLMLYTELSMAFLFTTIMVIATIIIRRRRVRSEVGNYAPPPDLLDEAIYRHSKYYYQSKAEKTSKPSNVDKLRIYSPRNLLRVDPIMLEDMCFICKSPTTQEERMTCRNCEVDFHEMHLKTYFKLIDEEVCPVCKEEFLMMKAETRGE
jgi:hypothetical protein